MLLARYQQAHARGMRPLAAVKALIQRGIDVAVKLLEVTPVGLDALTGAMRHKRPVMTTDDFKNQA